MSVYDIKKVKEIDKILLRDAERMNRLQWQDSQPLWRKLLFLELPIPKKYTLECLKNHVKLK